MVGFKVVDNGDESGLDKLGPLTDSGSAGWLDIDGDPEPLETDSLEYNLCLTKDDLMVVLGPIPTPLIENI